MVVWSNGCHSALTSKKGLNTSYICWYFLMSHHPFTKTSSLPSTLAGTDLKPFFISSKAARYESLDFQNHSKPELQPWTDFTTSKRQKYLVFRCRMPPLGAVASLSDDDGSNSLPGPEPQKRCFRGRNSLRAPAKKRILGLVKGPVGSKHLANLIRSKCGCNANCFRQFGDQQISEWTKLRGMMAKMTKLEKDQHVWVLLLHWPSAVFQPC